MGPSCSRLGWLDWTTEGGGAGGFKGQVTDAGTLWQTTTEPTPCWSSRFNIISFSEGMCLDCIYIVRLSLNSFHEKSIQEVTNCLYEHLGIVTRFVLTSRWNWAHAPRPRSWVIVMGWIKRSGHPPLKQSSVRALTTQVSDEAWKAQSLVFWSQVRREKWGITSVGVRETKDGLRVI